MKTHRVKPGKGTSLRQFWLSQVSGIGRTAPLMLWHFHTKAKEYPLSKQIPAFRELHVLTVMGWFDLMSSQ